MSFSKHAPRSREISGYPEYWKIIRGDADGRDVFWKDN